MYQLPFFENGNGIVWGEFIRTLKNLQVLPPPPPPPPSTFKISFTWIKQTPCIQWLRPTVKHDEAGGKRQSIFRRTGRMQGYSET